MEKRVTFNERWLPYFLVAPQIIITLVFFFWPSGQMIWQSVLLEDAFGGTVVTWFAQVADRPLARLHFIVRKKENALKQPDLEDLEKRLAERQLRMEISDKALDLLGNVGFDPVYGARPLKRAIQQQLENPLARQILEGKFAAGATIVVEAEQGHLVFHTQ